MASPVSPQQGKSQRSGQGLNVAEIWAQMQRRLGDLDSSEPPEDSLPLRVLVQAMVIVGILAVDVSAADAADALGVSLWAVPMSAVGAAWSWSRRRSRNIPVKFCIAIAMLIALAVFFVRLVAERNDTRLALAELLIQLQVFHSFDLPRRKDLGYSIVIGLILMGVAATLSQTFWFAPLLIAFVALGIPALVLDYRSQLGVAPKTLRHIRQSLPLRPLTGVLGITLALGLLIFAFLPRLPGYQLRAFPVSAPIEFEGQFDGGTILNPGYVRDGRASTGSGTGANGNVEGGEGQVDADFYYGFNRQMNQNLRGSLTSKVVMRVRSQSKGFWRVMAFDRYTGQGWEVSRDGENDVQVLERSPWTFRQILPWSVTLNQTREVIQTFTVVADLPNLVPALYEAKELYFPTRQIAIDPEGALRSPIPLSQGLTYTVVSEVPFRDRTRLRQAPTINPPTITDYYLDVPAAIAPRIRQTTEDALAKSPTPITAPYEKALYLAQYLKQNYRILPDLPFLEENEDLVEAFLYKYQGGYPDHFSTVLTVMLRSIGIPARLVVGFGAGEFNPFTGYYVVRNTDAFAMTEVYFHKYGWFAFNPIPGSDVIPTSVEESQVFATLKKFWEWIAGWLPSPVSGFLNGLLEAIAQGFGWLMSTLTGWFTRGWVGLLTGLLGLTVVAFLGWLGWSGWSSWRDRRWLNSLAPADALYQEMLRWLADQHIRKSPSNTPMEFARIAQQQQPAHGELIHQISQSYVMWRYGGRVGDLSRLRQQLQRVKQAGRSLKIPLHPRAATRNGD
ncbi:transglutaminase TgpA family protein [Thermoleptolyngbya sp.]